MEKLVPSNLLREYLQAQHEAFERSMFERWYEGPDSEKLLAWRAWFARADFHNYQFDMSGNIQYAPYDTPKKPIP